MIGPKTILSYLRQNRHPTIPVTDVSSLSKYFGRWYSFQRKKSSPLEEGIPWITFEAREYLEKILQPTMRVFEYGTGGSSLFLAKRVQQVIGVEHDEAWFKIVSKKMADLGIKNFEGMFCPPTPLDRYPIDPDYGLPDSYLSSDENYLNKFSFYNYASSIDRFANSFFDIVIVDGRARPSCIKHAIPKVRNGGYLIVDNSEREYYLKFSMKELAGFKKVFEKFGPVPFNRIFSATTFFRKIV